MKSCCERKSEALEALRKKQRPVLQIVLAVNAAMFLVEAIAGYYAGSSALQADALDMFGDAVVYGFSLYALDKGRIWTARAGLLKGFIMALFGFLVVAQVGERAIQHTLPVAETMGAIGALAFLANLLCMILLYRHRSDDINMRSTWLCSRNDILANLGVIAASWLVHLTASRWPDLAVGSAIALLFLSSAFSVIVESARQLRE